MRINDMKYHFKDYHQFHNNIGKEHLQIEQLTLDETHRIHVIDLLGHELFT
jgi:hypothetical protein